VADEPLDTTTTTDTTTSTTTPSAETDAATTTDATAESDAGKSPDTNDAAADKGGDDTEGTLLGDGGDDAGEGEGEGEGDEGGDDAEEAEGAPEKYEFSLKDAEGNDISLDEELVAEADPVLREMNLSNEQANKLMPLAQKMLANGQQSAIQQVIDAGAAQRKEWLDSFKADPDIGGSNQKESVAKAAVGLDAMGFTKGHPFRKALDESGFGNHPDVIRTFRQLGELAGEDGTFARSNSASEEKVSGWEDRYKTD
tara:strand:- start:1635 stop:2399 length:765 start_codon:yes stop_codon:yes gene_type:complete